MGKFPRTWQPKPVPDKLKTKLYRLQKRQRWTSSTQSFRPCTFITNVQNKTCTYYSRFDIVKDHNHYNYNFCFFQHNPGNVVRRRSFRTSIRVILGIFFKEPLFEWFTIARITFLNKCRDYATAADRVIH